MIIRTAPTVLAIYFISTVSETRAQSDLTVQCFTSDTCQRAQELAPMTIEDCCLNNPDALAFQRFGSEICEGCIGMCMPVLTDHHRFMSTFYVLYYSIWIFQ